MHPFVYDKGLIDFCQSRGIAVEAYSPLTRARRLHHPLINRIAASHGRSPAQILIRWALQHDAIVIPKSSHRQRIVENARVFDFELSPDETEALNRLSSR
jgi:diketogulonate reductase-like aldo/keto reductase